MKLGKLAGLAFLATVSAASAGVANAQSWQSIGSTNGSGGSFWNNYSDDQNVGFPACNAGAIFTNAALTPAACNSASPAALLPLSPSIVPQPTHYLSNGAGLANAFQFGAGTWRFDLLGSVTGASPISPYSYRNAGGLISAGSTANGSALLITSATSFWLTIDTWTPTGTTFASNVMNGVYNQFAAFTYGSPTFASSGGVATFNGTNYGQQFYIGAEDNGCTSNACTRPDGSPGRNSDRDYNDMLLRVTAVPEPASVALVAMGLGLVGIVARRRRMA